jgi:hypothetical protein
MSKDNPTIRLEETTLFEWLKMRARYEGNGR